MVDEMKAFNLLSEMIIEIRELRIAVSKKDSQIRSLEMEIKDLEEKVENTNKGD